MKRFLYIIYGLCLLGAARKAARMVSSYEEFHVNFTRECMRSSWFEIRLFYTKVSTIGLKGGDRVRLMRDINSYFFRRFRCRKAIDNHDCCMAVRKAMDRYIRSHGGLGEGVGYRLAPLHTDVVNMHDMHTDIDMSEFELVKEAFYGIPREL